MINDVTIGAVHTGISTKRKSFKQNCILDEKSVDGFGCIDFLDSILIIN